MSSTPVSRSSRSSSAALPPAGPDRAALADRLRQARAARAAATLGAGGQDAPAAVPATASAVALSTAASKSQPASRSSSRPSGPTAVVVMDLAAAAATTTASTGAAGQQRRRSDTSDLSGSNITLSRTAPPLANPTVGTTGRTVGMPPAVASVSISSAAAAGTPRASPAVTGVASSELLSRTWSPSHPVAAPPPILQPELSNTLASVGLTAANAASAARLARRRREPSMEDDDDPIIPIPERRRRAIGWLQTRIDAKENPLYCPTWFTAVDQEAMLHLSDLRQLYLQLVHTFSLKDQALSYIDDVKSAWMEAKNTAKSRSRLNMMRFLQGKKLLPTPSAAKPLIPTQQSSTPWHEPTAQKAASATKPVLQPAPKIPISTQSRSAGATTHQAAVSRAPTASAPVVSAQPAPTMTRPIVSAGQTPPVAAVPTVSLALPTTTKPVPAMLDLSGSSDASGVSTTQPQPSARSVIPSYAALLPVPAAVVPGSPVFSHARPVPLGYPAPGASASTPTRASTQANHSTSFRTPPADSTGALSLTTLGISPIAHVADVSREDNDATHVPPSQAHSAAAPSPQSAVRRFAQIQHSQQQASEHVPDFASPVRHPQQPSSVRQSPAHAAHALQPQGFTFPPSLSTPAATQQQQTPAIHSPDISNVVRSLTSRMASLTSPKPQHVFQTPLTPASKGRLEQEQQQPHRQQLQASLMADPGAALDLLPEEQMHRTLKAFHTLLENFPLLIKHASPDPSTSDPASSDVPPPKLSHMRVEAGQLWILRPGQKPASYRHSQSKSIHLTDIVAIRPGLSETVSRRPGMQNLKGAENVERTAFILLPPERPTGDQHQPPTGDPVLGSVCFHVVSIDRRFPTSPAAAAGVRHRVLNLQVDSVQHRQEWIDGLQLMVMLAMADAAERVEDKPEEHSDDLSENDEDSTEEV